MGDHSAHSYPAYAVQTRRIAWKQGIDGRFSAIAALVYTEIGMVTGKGSGGRNAFLCLNRIEGK